MQTNDNQTDHEAHARQEHPDLAAPEGTHTQQADAKSTANAQDASGRTPAAPKEPRQTVDLPLSFDIVAVLVMLATIVSAVFAGCQLQMTRDALMTEQRAWITIKTVRVFDGLKANGAPFIELRIVNSGQSPGLRVKQIEADSGFEQPCIGHKHGGTPAGSEQSESVIAPNAEYGQGYFHSTVTENDVTAIRTRKKNLYFWGTLRYDDIFGIGHTTKYCLRYDEDMVNIPNRIAPPLGWCGCHNEAQ